MLLMAAIAAPILPAAAQITTGISSSSSSGVPESSSGNIKTSVLEHEGILQSSQLNLSSTPLREDSRAWKRLWIVLQYPVFPSSLRRLEFSLAHGQPLRIFSRLPCSSMSSGSDQWDVSNVYNYWVCFYKKLAHPPSFLLPSPWLECCYDGSHLGPQMEATYWEHQNPKIEGILS